MTDRKKLRAAAMRAMDPNCRVGDASTFASFKALCTPETILSLLDDLDRKTVGEVVATMHVSDDGRETIFSKGWSPSLLGFSSTPLYLAPSPAIGREAVMTAVSVRDEETGAIHWQCTERDGRGEVSDEAVVTLAADTFPVGTRIEIIEPGAQP